MNSAKKDICSSLSQAKILLELLLKVKSSPIKVFSFLSFMLQAFSHLRTQLYSIIQGMALLQQNHTNISVTKGISYRNVFCYVDFLGEGRDGNSLVSETI